MVHLKNSPTGVDIILFSDNIRNKLEGSERIEKEYKMLHIYRSFYFSKAGITLLTKLATRERKISIGFN